MTMISVLPMILAGALLVGEKGSLLRGEGCRVGGKGCLVCFHWAYSWSLWGGRTAWDSIPLNGRRKAIGQCSFEATSSANQKHCW